LIDVAQLFFAGRLRAVVHAVLPLADARRAHEMMEASEHFGKIVLAT
jgi:NADPH:quinone reductase-like Zn-dependent oxidoreductase